MKPLSPERLNLEQLKNQAKTLLRNPRAKDPDALARFKVIRSLTQLPKVALHDAQSVVAREQGFKSWKELREQIKRLAPKAGLAGEEFTGRVVDKLSRQPVRGAMVRVRREVSHFSPWTERRVFEETKHLTDANGQFKFSITPEQSGDVRLSLAFDATHPDYARLPWLSNAMTMMRRNATLGERPFFENLELTPGETISGTVVRPDGSPAAGVGILTYSKFRQDDHAEYGSFGEATTDDAGSFSVNVIKGSNADLTLFPRDFVPSRHVIQQRRGDLGRFVLEEGIRARGRVVDCSGAPVKQVWVNADYLGGPARSALTDEQGEFVLGPLPAGRYDVRIAERARAYGAENRDLYYPLSDVFPEQTVRIDKSNATQFIEIRAVPSIVLGVQQFDGQGKPQKNHRIHVWGRTGEDLLWRGEGYPGESGKIRMKVPKGMTDVKIQMRYNEHTSIRHRWSDDAPWRNETEITVAALDRDTTGISVKYYNAPILMIGVAGAEGATVPNFKCEILYADGRKPHARQPEWVDGDTGDVQFEKRQDGRWWAWGLLPDEDLTLTMRAEGYEGSQIVRLAEGEMREIEVKLGKKLKRE